MKTAINILKWAFVVTGVLIIALLTTSFLLRNKVASILIESLNKGLSTRVEIGEYHLSLIRKFPKASVELANVTILSSPTFNRKEFKGINTDTLLRAKSLSLEFRMTDILKGNYTVQSITLSDGMLHLFSDTTGGTNYDITLGETGGEGESTVINLNRVSASSVDIRYINRATGIDASGVLSGGRFRSKISDREFDFICNANFIIKQAELFSTQFKLRVPVSLDMNLHQSDSGIVFRKGRLNLDEFRFALTGTISSAGDLDLRISGNNISLEKVKKYLPGKYAEEFAQYSPGGLLGAECSIKGRAGKTENPLLKLKFSVEKGKVNYRKSDISIRDLSLAGEFTNGLSGRPQTFSLKINDFSFGIGSSVWKGNLSVSNFSVPFIEGTFSGDIIPSELLSFFPVKEIEDASGSVRLNLSFSGEMRNFRNPGTADFLALDPQADLRFNSLSVRGKSATTAIDDIDGDLMIAENMWADDLYFTWKGQRFRLSGEFINMPAWLAGRPVKLKAYADLTADNLNPSTFYADSTTDAGAKPTAVSLPENLEADITFRVNNMTWDSFVADNVTGSLGYRSGQIEFSSVRMDALGGRGEGRFLITRKNDKSFLSQVSFTIDRIDINRTFRSFKNFGQDFIVADNLSGMLSGNFSLKLPLDSLLNPNTDNMSADGKYVIENGALVNFAPAKELSDFIEVSELENIKFSRLENDLFIKDGYVAIPQMEIKSSAADFTVSGKHFFDDSYEYHLKTYLSVLLSKKAKKGNSRDDFGAIEEDGLGRSSIFLKITGKDDDLKVSYDIKAAGNNIKQSLKKEKSNLKTILNEEYGWFRKDSAARKEEAPKQRFRISFPETDSVSKPADTTVSGKDRRNKSIFKKHFEIQQEN